MTLDRRQVRAALGVLWLVDAGLQAQPHFFTAGWWRDELAQSVMGEPQGVNHSIFWAVGVVAAHAAAWNAVFVAVQVAIGAALVLSRGGRDRWARAAIVASVPWALAIWWVGEGFGTLPTGFALLAAGSPGPVLYYPLLGLLAWPRRRQSAGGPAADRSPAAPAIGPHSSGLALDPGAGAGREPPVAKRAGLAAWVVLWAGQALLHLPWSFPPGQVLSANVGEYSLDQPGWLLAVARHTDAVVLAHPVAVTAGLGGLEVVVGLGVLARVGRRWALGAGIALSALYWVTFQYFGTIFGGDGTDPGTAPLMVLLALALWPARRPAHVGRHPTHTSTSPLASTLQAPGP
ncbi:MAG: hypothetical protein ACRDY0_00400 [Acidimicrobiales bacterium]